MYKGALNGPLDARHLPARYDVGAKQENEDAAYRNQVASQG